MRRWRRLLLLAVALTLRVDLEPGQEYDVRTNMSHISVREVGGGTLVDYWRPPHCRGRPLGARLVGKSTLLIHVPWPGPPRRYGLARTDL